MGALILGFFWIIGWFAASSEREGWRLCDEAIKATLKAPATYRRVMDNDLDSFSIGETSFIITYDAQNSFGVPLRGKGSCMIDASGKATWVEYPDSMR
jgi:hypothetical protein